jgi:cytochrome P450
MTALPPSRPSDFDPFDPATIESPYAYYQALRAHAPVYEVPGAGFTAVSRHDMAQSVAMQPDLYSSNLIAVLLAGTATTPQVLALDMDTMDAKPVDVLATVDPPRHTRQRKLVGRAFNFRRIAELEAHVRARTAELFARFEHRGRVEWMSELAGPLPLGIITDMLGLPRADMEKLTRWSESAIATLSGVITADEWVESLRDIVAFQNYLAERFREAEIDPPENVLGDLVRATREGEETLSREEALASLFQLFIAGNESTTSLIGSATRLLLSHDEVLRAVRADRRRIADLLEESLRLESPFQGHFRVVRSDTLLEGVPLAKGQRLMILWGSANRDERVFTEPDRFDLDRPNLKSHLGFGVGIHYCIGAPLARLEARIAIEALLDRLPRVRLASDARIRHVPSLFVRRLRALDLEFG